MHKIFRCASVMILAGGIAPLAQAGELKLTIGNGRATLIAQDVPLRQILAEWARLGQTTIVNGDKLTGPSVTLQLVDRPEREVLELLLRSASGYIAAQREVNVPGASVFDRVMILPTSRGPVGTAATTGPSPFPRANLAQQMPLAAMDDDEPLDPNSPNGPNGPNGANIPIPFGPNGPIGPNGPYGVNGPFGPNGVNPNGANPNFPNVPAQNAPGQQAPVLTSPRPGMLPPPPQGQPNPYGPTQVPNKANIPGLGPGGE
ncbi:MAG: hypothetical protein ABI818_14395 [Acidobacteriota bacterium]